MTDLFFNSSHILDRLFREYEDGEEMFIAFDFDDTVYDYAETGDSHDKVIDILKWAQRLEFPLILFTVREGERLKFAEKYVEDLGIKVTYVNTNPIEDSRKPFFNILLDDRCGLKQSYECLHMFLYQLEKKGLNYGKRQNATRC